MRRGLDAGLTAWQRVQGVRARVAKGHERERVRGREKNLKGGREVEREDKPSADAGGPPKFLMIHSWASLDAFETEQYRRAPNIP